MTLRQVVLDTETTGLEPALGHRIVELAALEMKNRRITGSQFHYYLNPEREIDAGALDVHGITAEFLQDKPRFQDVAREFIEYIRGAELVVHNAPFDIAFLDCELGRVGLRPVSEYCTAVVDTLKMAREVHPGKKNSLNALCERYRVDNSGRTLHGAMLDAELLVEIYLAMTRGQDSFAIEAESPKAGIPAATAPGVQRPRIVLKASAEELEAHERYLGELETTAQGGRLWKA